LFGHRKRRFHPEQAKNQKQRWGKISEKADGGTLSSNEVGDYDAQDRNQSCSRAGGTARGLPLRVKIKTVNVGRGACWPATIRRLGGRKFGEEKRRFEEGIFTGSTGIPSKCLLCGEGRERFPMLAAHFLAGVLRGIWEKKKRISGPLGEWRVCLGTLGREMFARA